VRRSADTTSWSINDLGTGISAVRFLNNRFVAVANSGIIFTSPDVANWGAQLSGTSHALLDVAYICPDRRARSCDSRRSPISSTR
jgi:hypothetical protein